MLRMAGIVLLIIGTSGTAWSYCREQKERLEYLKYIKQIYEFFQNEVIYAKAALPEICNRLSQRIPQPLGKAFAEIYLEISKNNGCSFEEIWEKHISECMKKLPLKKNEKEILRGFPGSLGFRDGKGQAEGMERYIEDASRYIKEVETELKSKNRVVMCMGVMSGIMAVIILF